MLPESGKVYYLGTPDTGYLFYLRWMPENSTREAKARYFTVQHIQDYLEDRAPELLGSEFRQIARIDAVVGQIRQLSQFLLFLRRQFLQLVPIMHSDLIPHRAAFPAA